MVKSVNTKSKLQFYFCLELYKLCSLCLIQGYTHGRINTFVFLVECKKYRDMDNIKDINIRRISFIFSCDVSLLDILKFLQMSNFFVIFTDIVVCCCIKIYALCNIEVVYPSLYIPVLHTLKCYNGIDWVERAGCVDVMMGPCSPEKKCLQTHIMMENVS